MLAKDTICAEMAFMFAERNGGSSSIDYPIGGAGASNARRSSCLRVGSFTFVASPSACRQRMTIHVMSSCHHSRPWRAENSNAWWLLCQPSPNASSPTHQLLRERSPVLYVW